MGLEDRLLISDTRSPAMTDSSGTNNANASASYEHTSNANRVNPDIGSNDQAINRSNGYLHGPAAITNSNPNTTASHGSTNYESVPNPSSKDASPSNSSGINTDTASNLNRVYHRLPTQSSPGPSTTTAVYQEPTYVHSSPSGPLGAGSGEEPPRKRRRPALSCEPCRRRKVRCDRAFPCGSCVRMRQQQACEYDNRFPTSGLPPGVNEFVVPRTGETRSQNAAHGTPTRGYADFESEVRQHAYSETSTGSRQEANGNGDPLPGPSNAVSSSLDELQQTVRELQYRVSRTERLASASAQPPVDYHALQGQLRTLEQRFKGLEDRMSRTEQEHSVAKSTSRPVHQSIPRPTSQQPAGVSVSLPAPRMRKGTCKLYGPTHYVHLFEYKIHVFGRLMAQEGTEKFDVSRDSRLSSAQSLFIQVRTLRETIKASSRITEVEPIQTTVDSVFHADVLHGLVGHYFDHLESIYRILHVPTFQRQRDKYRAYERISKAPPALMVQLLLVGSIGAVFVDDLAERKRLVSRWIYSAQSWLTGPSEKDFGEEIVIQNWCLLIIARQVNGIGTKEHTHALAGSMLKIAFSLGLHRDPSLLQGIAPLRAEVRRRLWSTILELSLATSLDAGRPPLLSVDDFDAEPPSDIVDSDLDDLAGPTQHPPISAMFTASTGIQRALRASFTSRLEIARMLNDCKHIISFEKALEQSQALQYALSKAHTLSNGQSDRILGTLLYEATLHVSQLYLCGAFLIGARTDQRVYQLHCAALASSKALLSKALNDSSGRPSPFGKLALRSYGSVFRSMFSLHALGIVSQKLLGQLPTLDKNMLPGGNDDVLVEILKQKEQECLQIVKAGDPSCKRYAFLHVTNAMIRSARSGKQAHEAVPQTFGEALRTCVLELQKLVDGDRAVIVPSTGDLDMSILQDVELGLDPGWLLGAWNFG